MLLNRPPKCGVSKHEHTRETVISGTSNANINFDDLCQLLRHMGFRERTKGSHRIFSKPGVVEILNLQPGRDGKAKCYQVKQVRELIRHYNLP